MKYSKWRTISSTFVGLTICVTHAVIEVSKVVRIGQKNSKPESEHPIVNPPSWCAEMKKSMKNWHQNKSEFDGFTIYQFFNLDTLKCSGIC